MSEPDRDARWSEDVADDSSVDAASADDPRLYIVHPGDWSIHAKLTWEKEYCHSQLPGQDYFHLILKGELYVQRETEKLCLLCALRRGVMTRDRLNWQKRTG